MRFRRQIAPLVRLEGAELDRAMSGIGMSFAVEPYPYPAIEDVLFFASQLGMEKNDFRVLNVLCKWIDVHAPRVNADRLRRLADSSADLRTERSGLARNEGRRVERSDDHQPTRVDPFVP